MLKRFSASELQYHSVEGDKKSCLIPLEGAVSVELQVRCEKEVDVNVVTVDGETILLDHGRIVRYSGKLEGCSAVEIVADTGFYYRCQKSSGWFEKVDPTPAVVTLEVGEKDVLKTMIEERLRRWEIAQEMNRPLTDDEKDELILDIANGDLEFDEKPDEFGLGYEERLAEFVAKQEEPQTPAEPASEAASSVVEPNPVPPAGDPKNSSST